jgi:ABC-2 type transport system ATP-binding protein
MAELLQIKNISKRFGTSQVLSDISFTVYSGEILGIIGPNGAGKTTLMECMMGVLPFDKGLMYWKDQQLAPLLSKEFMFYLPDGVLPYAQQRVERVLRFFYKIYGAEKALLELLTERLELSSVFKKEVHSLSKGFRRRLLLAIGLLAPQPLLMLDEPFDGFDLRQTLSVINLLRETLADRTLLLSIHQLTEAEKICDRFLLLDAGRVSAIGSLTQLQKKAGLNPDKAHAGRLEDVFLAII